MALFTVTSALLRAGAGRRHARRRPPGAGRRRGPADAAGLAIIGVAFTGAARAKAIAAYGLAMGVAAVSGQLLGGVLVEWDVAGLGWRSCFLINVPVGLARPGRRRGWCPSRGRPAGRAWT